jgi:RHS repeat-associated protein
VREVVPEGYKQTAPINSQFQSINFDSLVPNTILTDQFKNLGVTFSLLNSPSLAGPVPISLDALSSPYIYPPASGIAISPGSGLFASNFYDVEMSFASPIDYFSILSLDSDEPISALGYYKGNLVQKVSFSSGSGQQVYKLELGSVKGTQLFDKIILDVDDSGPEIFDNLTFNAVDLNFYTIQLKAGEIIENIDFGNTKINQTIPNQSPAFISIFPTIAQADQLFRYNAKAIDPDGDRLTYSLSLKPEGMTIDENTGLIVWKPTAAQLGTHDVILRAQDNLGGVTLQSAQILVQPTNHAPLFTSIVPDNAQVQSGKNFQFQSSAIDPDNDALIYSLASSTGNGTTIDATTGLVTWTPDDTQLGTRQFTILAADGKGGQAFQTVTLTVNAADNNQAPIFTSTPRTTTRIGSSYFYQIEATDPNGDALTYSLVNAPTGMTLENGLISWQSTAAQAGQQTVTIQASDGTLTTEQTYQITVSHQASNRAPVITSAPNLTSNIEQIYIYNLTGQDPDGDLVFWSLDQAPSGMVLDIQTGVLRWQSNQLGQQQVIVRLLDSYGDYSTQSFTLAVNGTNTPVNVLSNPITRVAVGQVYTYDVAAVDPENSSLTYSLGRRPNGMTIDATGKVEWTPTQVGSYDIDVSVTDNQGATTTQTYRLEVGSTAINHAPNITSTPGFVANVGSAYQYQIEANDPDGQTLRYQLLESPQGMTIDAASGLLSWTTPVNGNYQVVLAVFDSEGLGVTQGYTLTAKTNSLPVIRSTPGLEAVPNQTYRYDLQAVDPDGDSLRYSLDATSQALGMTLDTQGRLTWTPNNSQLGDHAVTLTAIDGSGGATQQTFTLKVTADTTAPQVRINRSISLINQGETVSFQVIATDNIGVANLQLLINDTPVVIDSNGVASFTATTTGVITAKAVALDGAGNRGEATTTVNVSDPTDTEAPTVSLDLSGIVNGEITAPVEIKGSVNDTNLAYYVLEVAPADGSQPFKEMFRGTSTVNNGVLGVLDPTLLPNDTYKVRLVAYDVNGAGNGVSELLDVKGDLKLGNFQLSFTDLEIPVAGIPITLTRTYDTLTSNSQDDFGYGWRMEFRNAQVRTSLPKDELYEEYGFRSVGFKEGDSVYITLPGGKRERFTFSAKPKGLLAFIGLVTPTFLPDDGVTSTLTVADTPLIRGDGGRLIPFSGGSVFGYYMPEDWSSHYTLTTKEGIVYQINTETGDIDSITNRNGDVLSFSDGGIVSSNGQQVTFERDAKGRIVTAIDPMGNRIKYQYDANGDLVKVTDRENNTTTFEYNGQQAHYLDKIIDPLGKTGVRNEYDENGRLTKVFNALGNSVQLEYNPDNSLYTTKDALGNATTYEYDVRGNIITEVDAKGGITRRTYDEDNNLLSETNPEGETSSSTYDSSGNKLTETDALGNVTRYTYNTKGDLLSTTDALGNTVTNTYDSNGNPTAISGLANGPINLTYGAGGLLTTLTTAEGTTTYEYDGRGNVTKEIDPLGHETTYTYDGNGDRLTETRKLTTSTGVKTLVTTTEYNAKGDVIKVTDALGNVTQMAYDANGQKTQEIDALGRVTKYVYSDAGQLLETIYADATPNDDSDNPRTRKEYDAANRVIAEIDELGRRTEFQYDALGRLTFTLFPDLTPNDASDNARTESRYDDAGRVIAEVDERGNITRYEYDGLGRRTKTILPDGTANNDSDNPQMVVTYDALGRQLTQVDPLGRTTQFLYDGLGRSIGQIFADKTDISTTYDLAGRVVGKTDQIGNKTQYEYNAVGQLTAVIDALNQRTEYQYNELGNLISQKDALGNITRYQYDSLGRRIATDLPLGQEATMTYDAVGNLLSTTDFNGETIHFEYDERNRLLSRIFPDNSRVAYTYTLTGQRATETSSLGTITYSYDVRDNLLSRVDADGVKIEYSYDAANNRTAVKVPSGQTSYSFDEQNRLKTVTDPQAGVTTYTYDLAGNLIKTTLANGTTETREYDLLNRLLYLQNSNSSGVINSFRYTLDKVGNRLAIVEQDGRQSNYQYDALYRLLQEEIIDGTTRTIGYTYDVVSNRLTLNDSLEGNTSYEYDGNDRLLKEVTNGVTTTYTYDNNGNTLTKTVGTAKMTYEWDVENRLVGADTDGDGVNDVTNEYDGDGVRIRQTVAGEETRFLVDKNRDYAQVWEEYTPSKIIKASYIYGHDLISQLRDTERSFYHVDGLGSTRALTDINGLLTDAYAYEAFGEIIKQLGNTQNSYLFAGEQRDPNLGLDYLRARYLDINSGRFYGRDPFPEQITNSITLNRYIYVNNSPINFVDPSGEFGMIAGIGFALNALAILSAFGTGYQIGTIINRVRAGESLMSSSNLKSIASVTLALVPLGFLASKVAPLAKVAAELEKLGWKSVIFDTAPGLNFSNRVFHFVQQLYGRGFTSKDAIDAVTKGSVWFDTKTGAIARVIGDARANGTIKVVINKAGKIVTVYSDKLGKKWQQIAP